jgi:hypothetical protein
MASCSIGVCRIAVPELHVDDPDRHDNVEARAVNVSKPLEPIRDDFANPLK